MEKLVIKGMVFSYGNPMREILVSFLMDSLLKLSMLAVILLILTIFLPPCEIKYILENMLLSNIFFILLVMGVKLDLEKPENSDEENIY